MHAYSTQPLDVANANSSLALFGPTTSFALLVFGGRPRFGALGALRPARHCASTLSTSLRQS